MYSTRVLILFDLCVLSNKKTDSVEIGAGIGGLSCALGLRKIGHNVKVPFGLE